MGHFGKRPIRLAWLWFVFPALLLNYFGQGALLLREPDTVRHPFFHLAPDWALYPMVVLATLATVIASQAVISGAYSLTRQAIQLGYCPRLMIEHTSEKAIGQVYLPWINWGLYLAVIGLVLGFGSSSNLAGAYGIAVTATMAIDSILVFFVMRRLWHWPLWAATPISAAISADRSVLLRRQHGQDPGWRLVPRGGRHRRLRAAVHLEARARDPVRAPAARAPSRSHRSSRASPSTRRCACRAPPSS